MNGQFDSMIEMLVMWIIKLIKVTQMWNQYKMYVIKRIAESLTLLIGIWVRTHAN
jgi:hypothetical protein